MQQVCGMANEYPSSLQFTWETTDSEREGFESTRGVEWGYNCSADTRDKLFKILLKKKKKLWLHETLAPILNWCDPPLCNKLLRCLQPSTFSSSQTSAPGDNRWQASCIHTTPFQTAHLQHPSSWRFSHPPLWLWDSALLGTQWGTPAGCLVPQQLYSSVVQQQGYQTVRHAKVNHAKQRSKIFCFQLSSWSYFLFKRTS